MLAITTTQAFWLINPDSEIAWQIDCGKGVYYGISFNANYLFLAARQAAYGDNRDTQENVILCYDTKLNLRRILTPPFDSIRDAHQIAVVDGHLYVVSTYDDLIACWNMASDEWSFWAPFGSGNFAKDVHHINSIFISNNRIYLAGLHPKGWVAIFDKHSRNISGYFELGMGTHNVWLENDVVFVCSSNQSAIINRSGELMPIIKNAWVRGFCFCGKRRFVGASENLIREDRPLSNCYVIEIDEKFALVNSLEISGCGMLHDIRSLNIPDINTHNTFAFEVDERVLARRFISRKLPRSTGMFALD